MNNFDPKTVGDMRRVFDEVCSHIPAGSTAARTLVAVRIIECAGQGKLAYHHLLEAGRRAVIEEFGDIKAIERLYA